MPKDGLEIIDGTRARIGRAVLAEPHNAVKVSTACPSSLGLFLYAALCRNWSQPSRSTTMAQAVTP